MTSYLNVTTAALELSPARRVVLPFRAIVISMRLPLRLRLTSMPEIIEVLPHLLGALGDIGAVIQLLAGLFQLVGELADGSA